MDITLRKANAIQDSIRDAINSIDIKVSVELNEFQDIDKVITDATAKLYELDQRRFELLTALYNIRGLVGQANASAGINLKLATAALYDKRVVQLEDFKRLAPMLERDVIVGKLEKIRTQPIESGRFALTSRDTVVSTTILTQTEIDQAAISIKELKKKKQKINDEVLALNVSTTIPLTDEVVATLTTEGIL